MNIEQLLAPDMMYALGWALIHSLWQGAILAILLGLAFLVFRKTSSIFRYRLSLVSLSLVFVFFIGTFVMIYANIEETKPLILIDNGNSQIVGNQSFMTVYANYCNQHLPFIVTLWFLGMVFFTLRFLGSLAVTQRLRFSHHLPVSFEMEELLFDIQKRMDIQSKINWVESSLIPVPMVIGYLKPMILMPIGLINQLTICEVEAILAHELAHIKRYDYLINMLQSIIETILFFHPAVWWISGEIRRERENCCDDLALEITDAITFAKSLANVAQFRANFIHKRKPQLSMAALNNKNQLLNRVRRILNQPQKNQGGLKGLFAACILIVSFIATSLDAQQVKKIDNEVVTSETTKFPVKNTDFQTIEIEGNTISSTDFFIDESELLITKQVTHIFDENDFFIKNKKRKSVGDNFIFGFTPKKNNKGIARFIVLKDTSITGITKEVVIVREVIGKDGKAKEVKIKVKTKDDKREINVFEDGRKLSESEEKAYQQWIDETITSTDNEAVRSEREKALAQREVEVAIRKEQVKVREIERETRGKVDEERRAIAEEKVRLAEEKTIIRKEIVKEQAIVYRELTKVENERLTALRKEQGELAKKIGELQKTKEEGQLKLLLSQFKQMELELKQMQMQMPIKDANLGLDEINPDDIEKMDVIKTDKESKIIITLKNGQVIEKVSPIDGKKEGIKKD
jgi:beta-lactamase regulating signal transducer with metallopeptidase domain